MEVYDWYHGLKNALKENYNIPIEDVHKFARVINEFRNNGYDITYILREFWEISSSRLEIKVLLMKSNN